MTLDAADQERWASQGLGGASELPAHFVPDTFLAKEGLRFLVENTIWTIRLDKDCGMASSPA